MRAELDCQSFLRPLMAVDNTGSGSSSKEVLPAIHVQCSQTVSHLPVFTLRRQPYDGRYKRLMVHVAKRVKCTNFKKRGLSTQVLTNA